MTTAHGSTTATDGEEFERYGHSRFSIGPDDGDDRIADLARALDKAAGSR